MPADVGGRSGAPVVRFLAQRGLAPSAACPVAGTFLPFLKSGARREGFYRALDSYAFRLFLRDILVLRDRYLPERLGPFFTPGAAEEMAATAERLGLLRRRAGRTFRLLAGGVTDFGPTFEWFAAEVLRRKFRADVLWGVTIPDLPCGGDFDVLALVSGRLLYMEAKTSPPKHIEFKEMEAFAGRVAELSPDIAVLLADTHLRMKDKLAPLLSEALRLRGAKIPEMSRIENEIFHWEERLFLANSRRDIAANIATCLRRHFLGRFFR